MCHTFPQDVCQLLALPGQAQPKHPPRPTHRALHNQWTRDWTDQPQLPTCCMTWSLCLRQRAQRCARWGQSAPAPLSCPHILHRRLLSGRCTSASTAACSAPSHLQPVKSKTWKTQVDTTEGGIRYGSGLIAAVKSAGWQAECCAVKGGQTVARLLTPLAMEVPTTVLGYPVPVVN